MILGSNCFLVVLYVFVSGGGGSINGAGRTGAAEASGKTGGW